MRARPAPPPAGWLAARSAPAPRRAKLPRANRFLPTARSPRLRRSAAPRGSPRCSRPARCLARAAENVSIRQASMQMSWLAEMNASAAPIAQRGAPPRAPGWTTPAPRSRADQRQLHQQQPAAAAAEPRQRAGGCDLIEQPAPREISACRPGRYWRSARSRRGRDGRRRTTSAA